MITWHFALFLLVELGIIYAFNRDDTYSEKATTGEKIGVALIVCAVPFLLYGSMFWW